MKKITRVRPKSKKCRNFVGPMNQAISQNTIRIRRAALADAPFIAWGFMTAMWMDESDIEQRMSHLVLLAERDDTLYSWRHAWVAEDERGEAAAVLIAYDGASYRAAAQRTFTYVRDAGGPDFTQMEQEAGPGEWYLDSLAVRPAFRHQGIARRMLEESIRHGLRQQGIERVTLVVDPAHTWVEHFYASLGFRPAELIHIFGQDFRKMEYIDQQEPDILTS